MKAQSQIQPETLAFLSELAKNNEKEWFLANKSKYEAAKANAFAFAKELSARIAQHDHIQDARPGNLLYRIHNDLRFHKNKPPYNPRFAGGFGRVKPALRGGYYWHIQPGNSYVACGFFGPNPDDLRRIRQDIDDNFEDWQAVLADKNLRNTYGKMGGEQLKTVPAGFPKDHPAIELLRHKSFVFQHDFSDAEVLSADFPKLLDQCFRDIRPFFDYMSEVLTTDRNGVSII